MRHVVMLLALAALAALAAACAPSVPDAPTWTEDVRPMVLANCTRCHSPPSLGGAITIVRLDKFEDEDRDLDGSRDMFGAHAEAMLMADRTEADEMPPDFSLFPSQKELLRNWADSGAPKGPPLEGNEPPTMELLGDFEASGDLLVADYRIDDPDGDLVTGKLLADPNPDVDGDELPVTFDLFSGQAQIAWNVSGVAPGSYDLTAEIDDASAVATVDLGSIEVQP
ncbi:MAG TPA: hypothetical protein VKB80_34310 [Kofleriaceae bacterium]|nr:hypothetical protein [Kofleriaceae bacterium]